MGAIAQLAELTGICDELSEAETYNVLRNTNKLNDTTRHDTTTAAPGNKSLAAAPPHRRRRRHLRLAPQAIRDPDKYHHWLIDDQQDCAASIGPIEFIARWWVAGKPTNRRFRPRGGGLPGGCQMKCQLSCPTGQAPRATPRSLAKSDANQLTAPLRISARVRATAATAGHRVRPHVRPPGRLADGAKVAQQLDCAFKPLSPAFRAGRTRQAR